ncbi:hypothetical protein GPECTOR_28g772 [Gonium pectorale]|uniref:F-box domain-containing protein n=1 Tax=Gonium pectorale TaxID=33097 RepID=A0A150GFK1_GONPE|nr:hypothetical protein GPECTOR_28g772 [Gonium pectorale]|eukprot:KXZ48365.1 hypothetical protein GPECTOR_28g772 [Gonium pectorale]
MPDSKRRRSGASSAARVWPQLPTELAEHIISFLEPNEVPGFRLVNQAAAAQFRGPSHTTICLSQPVPPQLFAAHWLDPGSTRGLTLKRRRQLLSLTAASGVVANLEVALRAAGCSLTPEVFLAAAAAGRLDMCRWLLQRGCPTTKDGDSGSQLLAAAARGGQQHMCEWLVGLDLTWIWGGFGEAARGGHLDLMEWLLQRRPQLDVSTSFEEEAMWCVAGAIHSFDLPTLQRLWRRWGELSSTDKEEMIGVAAGSKTPDWAAKIEWLEAQGCPRGCDWAASAAADSIDAVARLTWLRERGYSLNPRAVWMAACVRDAAALRYLLVEAAVPPDPQWVDGMAKYGEDGNLEALQALHAAGWPLDPGLLGCEAAQHGQLRVLSWLLEALGEEALGMGAQLFASAAESGSVELLAWLRRRGCEWGSEAFTAAVESGCEEAVEWLLTKGCPVEAGGAPYLAACRNGDLATVRLLRRLGVPWDAVGAPAV